MKSEPETFTLAPAEEAFFRRFVQRLMLPWVAGVGAVVVLLFLVMPSVVRHTPRAPSEDELVLEIDVRAEVDRRFRELAKELREGTGLPDPDEALAAAEKAAGRAREAQASLKKLRSALDRLDKRLAALEAMPAGAAPDAAASAGPALEEIEERLTKLELSLPAAGANVNASPPAPAPTPIAPIAP